MTRTVTSFIFVAFAIVLITAAPAAAQDNDPPQRRDRQNRQVDRDQQRPARQIFEVDPATDPILKEIRDAVEPTDSQMQIITANLQQLRAAQQQAFADVREEFMQSRRQMGEAGERPPRGRRGVRGEAGDRSERGADGRRPQRGQRGNNAMRQQMMEKVNAAFKSLNATFLADSRAALNEDQHDAWDLCAAHLNLNPLGSRQQRDVAGPAVGDKAPTFNILTTTGDAVKLESLLDKPTVIEFASYTCPIFRGKINDMTELREHFGDSINYIIVYTREAHATDGRRPTRRNVEKGIDINEHTSFDDRKLAAQQMQIDLSLQDVTVLVDSFDDQVTNAFRGHPNRGYVIDIEGKVRSRQQWIDAEETRKVLESLLLSQESASATAGDASR